MEAVGCMWPNSKGKGGKGGSSKKDGNEGGKPRATRTKMKAMQAAGDDTQSTADAEANLEKDIFEAATRAAQEELAREEAMRSSSSGSFLKLPDKPGSNMDEQLSGVWKSRLMGQQKGGIAPGAAPAAAPIPTKDAQIAAEKARAGFQHEAMVGVVDRMFDHFQSLAYEFNQVARGSDLELTWIRPSISRENYGSWHQGVQYVNVFSGRISTRYWTLVVRGTYESICAYVIPVDKLLTFSSDPGHYGAIIELIPVFDGISVSWYIGEKAIGLPDLEQAYRATLDCLVQVAQEDRPPAAAINIFAEQAEPVDHFVQNSPGPADDSSVFGDELDYSQRYKQHLSGGHPALGDSASGLAPGPGAKFQQSAQPIAPESQGQNLAGANPFISSASHPRIPPPFSQPTAGTPSTQSAPPGGAAPPFNTPPSPFAPNSGQFPSQSSSPSADWKPMGSSSASFSTKPALPAPDEFRTPQFGQGHSSGSFPQQAAPPPPAPPKRDDNDGWREVPGRPPIPGVKQSQSQSGSNPFIGQPMAAPGSPGLPAPGGYMGQSQGNQVPAKDDNWNFVPLDKAQSPRDRKSVV